MGIDESNGGMHRINGGIANARYYNGIHYSVLATSQFAHCNLLYAINACLIIGLLQ